MAAYDGVRVAHACEPAAAAALASRRVAAVTVALALALALVLACALSLFAMPGVARAADAPPAERIEAPRITNVAPNASMPGVPNEGRPPPAPKSNSIVRQPRSFGYVIGDVFTQRVLLELEGRPFVPAELPIPGRAGIWFERRAIRTETDSGGHRWLAVDYQLMNSPQALAVATLPSWKLHSTAPEAELRIAEWPITVGPLTPEKPFTRSGLGALRPDHLAAPVDISTSQRALIIAIVLLIMTLASWLAWWGWRNWRASASQPFAKALREMRNVDDSAPEAWLALHRAFDGTAGRTLRAESLGSWLDRAPQFRSLRPSIEQFFEQSAARFFAGEMPERAVSVHSLCRELRRIEKRHEP